jgi:hypothetical protein
MKIACRPLSRGQHVSLICIRGPFIDFFRRIEHGLQDGKPLNELVYDEVR